MTSTRILTIVPHYRYTHFVAEGGYQWGLQLANREGNCRRCCFFPCISCCVCFHSEKTINSVENQEKQFLDQLKVWVVCECECVLKDWGGPVPLGVLITKLRYFWPVGNYFPYSSKGNPAKLFLKGFFWRSSWVGS